MDYAPLSSQALPAPPDLAFSPKVGEILQQIVDEPLRAQVDATVRYALAALADWQRIHLPQDQFEDQETKDPVDIMHLELAPYVLSAVVSTKYLVAHVIQAFPAPEETRAPSDDSFDLEFDLMDGPVGEGAQANAARHVELPPAAAVAEAAHAFGAMLRSRVVAFGDRLSRAAAKADGWPLLAELDDNKHRLSKAVQGVLFGVLSSIAPNVRREEILPEYRSAVGEAIRLRSAIANLNFHVDRSNAAVNKAAAGDMVPLVVALADRLARFCARPEYRSLRAEDKRAIIDFRRALHDMRHRTNGVPAALLHLTVEGFAKFLESMHAINHREVLVIHDRQRLQEAAERLSHAGVCADGNTACNELDSVVSLLGAVQGRSSDLDQARRNYLPPDASQVAAMITQWQGWVDAAARGL